MKIHGFDERRLPWRESGEKTGPDRGLEMKVVPLAVDTRDSALSGPGLHGWRLRSATTILMFLMIVGCGSPSAHRNLGFLNGKFVTDPGVRVFPDRHWRFEEGRGHFFRKMGTLLVWVEGDAPEGLRATLTPFDETERFHFMVLWDEDRLWDRPAVGGKAISVDIPSSALRPGLHRLTIERVRHLDDDADQKLDDNSFSQIDFVEVRNGTTTQVALNGNAFIASFLDFGVTGQSEYRLDGCLFDGPQRLADRIVCDAESSASFTLENRSREPAVFRVGIGPQVPIEYEVPARGKRDVTFNLPAGEHELALEVSGYGRGSFLWGAPSLQQPGGGDAPSVFFITLDTTRWDSVAPFSTTSDLTPNLRALAAESTVFSNAWAVAPWTLPAHASMFTGLYPSHHGAGVTSEVLHPRSVTLAERFRDNGYVTAGFIGGHMSSSVFGLAQGFSVYHDPVGWEAKGDSVTESALDFIETNAASPMFVFVNYFDPHEPYSAPENYKMLAGVPGAERAARDVPIWGDFARGDEAAWGAIRAGRASEDPLGMAYLRATYLAEVAFMDAQLGLVLAKLRELEIYDNAMIVVIADHGEFLGERGRYSHSYSLDPELTKIPLLVKWPRQRTRVDVKELVSQIDLFPAVASLVGTEFSSSDGIGISGDSMSALASRPFVLMEEHSSRIHPLPGRMWIADHLFGFQWRERREVIFEDQIRCEVLRDGTWTPTQCDMDWEDRAGLLGEKMRATARVAADHEIGDLDSAEAEKLRALGYIE